MLPVVCVFPVLLLVSPAQVIKLPEPVPTQLGDADLDWSVDEGDFVQLQACLTKPGLGATTPCAAYDFDGDGDTDLHDIAAFQAAFTGAEVLNTRVEADADDGTETNHTVWSADGFWGNDLEILGVWHGNSYDTGIRFYLPQVRTGETFAYARLVLPGTGLGQVISEVNLRIVGVAQTDPGDFAVQRPSQLPKTAAAAAWVITSDWPDTSADSTCTPFNRYSPDISAVVNEIVGRSDWNTDSSHATLALVIEDQSTGPTNFVVSRDFSELQYPCQGTTAPRLELYRTLRSTFVAKEFLTRPTDSSITVTAMSLVATEVYFEFGSTPDLFDRLTPVTAYPGGTPIQVVLNSLSPDTRYYYRMRYRRPGEESFAAGSERTFHTRRSRGSSFTFAVQSDSHRYDYQNIPQRAALYQATLKSIWAEAPDFLIDLGDTFNSESYGVLNSGWDPRCASDDALDLAEALERYLAQRPYLDLACHSSPFFLVLGNHEGEQGWRLNGTPNNVAVWSTQARKSLYPQPTPGDFYTGNPTADPFCGLREDYYAWEWGNALFVVLDPFWYTTTKPHNQGNIPGSGDNWDWTLGREQYDWLQATLRNSSAAFKFVFIHHLTGGVNTYGRGGIEAVRYALARRGSYEWGGEDASGVPVFNTKRPGWGDPIHQLLVNARVTVLFHGHDHAFVRQELDGITYQECPQTDDSTYSSGLSDLGLYRSGNKVNNSGHLRVTVSPAAVTVDYVRAYLDGDGPDGEVAYSYTLPAR